VPVRVAIEEGKRRVFAAALDWPGWCRSARTEAEALEVLAAYRARYAPVPRLARVRFVGPDVAFEVIERGPGTATTDFGAPDVVAGADRAPTDRAEARRLRALVAASWTVLEDVVAGAPPVLRRGPRGGGRDRDPIVHHVEKAERAYGAKLGIRRPADVVALRAAVLERLGTPSDGVPVVERGWPPRYAARRIAWHALDHAWEIEDKS